MNTFIKYMPLLKVNEGRREIEGIICSESLDREGERMDYSSSKPNFIAWSNQISKATGGKNLGNLREMHGLKAVGVGRAINFDDAAHNIRMQFRIVDDSCWAKCLTGCLNSFSIGGQYQKKWKGADGTMWYQALPAEVSVVDAPANADCSFELIHANGSREMRKFHKIGDPSMAKFHEYADALIAKYAKANPDQFRDGDTGKWSLTPDKYRQEASQLRAMAAQESSTIFGDQGKAEAYIYAAQMNEQLADRLEGIERETDEVSTLMDAKIDKMLRDARKSGNAAW